MRGIKRGGRQNGTYVQVKRGALSRECPRCGAKPQWRCLDLHDGENGTFGRRITTFHKERMVDNGAQE